MVKIAKNCDRNIDARARPEESVVPLSYLQDLHLLHEEWLAAPDPQTPAKILVFDVDEDVQENPDIYRLIFAEVTKFASERGLPAG
jgi:hypothetical protein